MMIISKGLSRLQELSADKIATLVAFLASEASAEVTNQFFCVRKNELFLFSKPRSIRTIRKLDGLTAEMLPAFCPSFYPNERSGKVFA